MGINDHGSKMCPNYDYAQCEDTCEANITDYAPDWPPDYKYTPVRNLCEQMQALYEADDLCGLTAQQWDDIFYDNAAKVFYPILERRLAEQ